jgi:site-specific DNA-methyltransferase (adenine-specific)
VHYVFEARIDGLVLRDWLRREWRRSGLPWRKANEACGVKNAATRKYLDRGHLWYFPPPEMFEKLAAYADEHGQPKGRPYFSRDGKKPMDASEWAGMRSKFYCPHGFTNVWERNALRGKERIKAPKRGSKAAHLNQKPLDLIKLIIEASSDPGDVIWEPFGGLFTAALAARMLKRKAFACEIDPVYFSLGVDRFSSFVRQGL